MGMYEGIKTATSPMSVKTAPLKARNGEFITDQSKQLQCWIEHYLELYLTQNTATDTALDALPGQPVKEELDVQPAHTGGAQQSHRLSHLQQGTRKDGILQEVLKHGKQAILQPLHQLLCLC